MVMIDKSLIPPPDGRELSSLFYVCATLFAELEGHEILTKILLEDKEVAHAYAMVNEECNRIRTYNQVKEKVNGLVESLSEDELKILNQLGFTFIRGVK